MKMKAADIAAARRLLDCAHAHSILERCHRNLDHAVAPPHDPSLLNDLASFVGWWLSRGPAGLDALVEHAEGTQRGQQE